MVTKIWIFAFPAVYVAQTFLELPILYLKRYVSICPTDAYRGLKE